MERIEVDASKDHPGTIFVQDTQTRDTYAVDRATGAIVGSHRGDYRRGLSVELIDAALAVSEQPARR
jgi:hypothetical protein